MFVEAFLSSAFVIGTNSEGEVAEMVGSEFNADVDGSAGGIFTDDDALAVDATVFVSSRDSEKIKSNIVASVRV